MAPKAVIAQTRTNHRQSRWPLAWLHRQPADAARSLAGLAHRPLSEQKRDVRSGLHQPTTALPTHRALTAPASIANHKVVNGLAEMSIGDWEDERFEDLNRERNLIERFNKDINWAPPKGEGLATVAARMRREP